MLARVFMIARHAAEFGCLKELLRGASVLMLSLAASAVVADQDNKATEGELLFVRRIQPLLQQKCIACHGQDPEDIQGGLDLGSSAGLKQGGDSGVSSINVDSPAESPLLLAVQRDHDEWSAMPPKYAEKLDEVQVSWIKTWLEAGAPWPSGSRAKELGRGHADAWASEDGISVPTSGGLAEAWTTRKYDPEGLWAYQPVVKPIINSGTATAIDQLVELKQPIGLAVAPPADPATLIRRMTYGLLGLPPTSAQVQQFVQESDRDRQAAVERLVDRLLASKHYGERMAQHWLDVVRYADSSGFANDFERGSAWRYRDYVVRAFNADTPFDQFVLEQIAGDELDSDNPEAIVATGFLRMGPWELTGMEVAKIARQRFLDDVTNSVGETFLAHSLQCARCHDHKFDPVPTRDYYAVQAVFATTQLAERKVEFLPNENLADFDERQYLDRMQQYLTETLEQLDRLALNAAKTWYAEQGIDPKPWQDAIAKARKGGNLRRGLFNAARNVLLNQGFPEDQFPPRMLGWSPQEIGMERVASKGIERLAWMLDRYQPYALAVYNGRTPQMKSIVIPQRVPKDRMESGELEQTCILAGGDPFSPSDPVQPGILSVLDPEGKTIIPDSVEGRRAAFAKWVADSANPLTTRTIVNRVWMWHFGQPIAGNPNNFGSTGKKPTHPELLDWLAATLVEEGWSLKKLHRYILTSEVYQRSSTHPNLARLEELDPLHQSFAVFQPRRLSAEEIRDSMLFISNELNPAIGGIPNRPEMNLEAALQPRQVMGTYAFAWVPNATPEQRHRRSLYALKLRGLTDPALEVFNVPSPDFSCERRDASTVAPQVFALFNSAATLSRSLALARRALEETDSDEQAVTHCFELAFGRSPTADEKQLAQQHFVAMQEVEANARYVKSTPPTSIVREAIEENTGEKFSFQEPLYENNDFQPDLHPADCDVRTRALANLCLVLMNSNEFVYVY